MAIHTMSDPASLLSAVLLGTVEGLTEFLPVSSTGHLIITRDLLGLKLPQGGVMEVFIQLGAVLAVLFQSAPRFREMLRFRKDVKEYAYRNVWMGLAFAAFLPAAVIGLLAGGYIKAYFFNSFSVACALILGGFAMLAAEFLLPPARTVLSVEQLGFKRATLIGFFQTVALFPGASRSACTIIGGMILGADRRTAAEFSFLLALPTLAAAAMYDLLKHADALDANAAAMMAVGFVTAFITAMISIKALLYYVSRFSFIPFAIYRIVLGVVLLAFVS